MYVLCHVAWVSALNLFIYRSIGWTTVHHIDGLSLCMSEWVYLWAMCLFLLSFVNMSAHKFSAKYSAIEWKTTLYEPFMQADITHTHKRTNNWLLSFYIGSLCLWAHNNLYRLMRMNFFNVYWLFNWHRYFHFVFVQQTNKQMKNRSMASEHCTFNINGTDFICSPNKQSFCRWNSLHLAGFICKRYISFSREFIYFALSIFHFDFET